MYDLLFFMTLPPNVFHARKSFGRAVLLCCGSCVLGLSRPSICGFLGLASAVNGRLSVRCMYARRLPRASCPYANIRFLHENDTLFAGIFVL